MIHHPWHEVDPGDRVPEVCWAFIEISRKSRAKYEIDKKSGLLKLDRVLYSSVMYPANYGFIPRTMHADGDPLDVLVLSQIDITPHCLVEVNIIGVMQMMDQGESDDKILAVAARDPSVNYIRDISDMPPNLEKEIIQFFNTYSALENKQVKATSFVGRETAFRIINEGIELYREKAEIGGW